MHQIEAMKALIAKYDVRSSEEPTKPYPVEGGDGLPVGWLPLVERLLKRLIALGWDRRLAVAKEKMGSLRFEILGASGALRAIIDRAEARSAKTCDTCGKPGSLWQARRIVARCQLHVPPGAAALIEERSPGRRVLVRRGPA